MQIVRVAVCDSTNALLGKQTDAPHGLLVVADRQTAGRGQRGNSWEAEPGKNLTFSILLRPKTIPACRQFELSMLVALAVAKCVRDALSGVENVPPVTVKWPNDIYIGDMKVCGLLLENTIIGSNIDRCIVGIGLNVNQRKFESDAPNPVSIINYLNKETQLQTLLEAVANAILESVDSYSGAEEEVLQLCKTYKSNLWRGVGEHLFCEPEGEPFMASIVDVATNGILSLSNGRSYAFKEVAFILPPSPRQ